MLLYKNLTTNNKELSDFYGLGIFFSKCYCLTTLPFLENMSMHFILKTFTSHCKKWPIRSALALLKDGNCALMQAYKLQCKLKEVIYSYSARNHQNYIGENLLTHKILFRLVLNLKPSHSKTTPTAH